MPFSKEKKKLYDRRRLLDAAAKGICISCRKITVVNTSVRCEECWFKKMAFENLGNRHLHGELRNKLYEQSFKCAYTGRLLIIGKNASVDHIVPISYGGKKSLSNVQWVDIEVNRLKSNISHAAFMAIAKEIARYHKELPRKG